VSQLNDAILAATGGPTVNDGLSSHYGRTPTESLQDAERRWLIAQSSGTPVDQLGPELIENGDMSSAVGWDVTGPWNIAGGLLNAPHLDGGQLRQNLPVDTLEAGKTYKVAFDVIGATYANNGIAVLIDGQYQRFMAPPDGRIEFDHVQAGTNQYVLFHKEGSFAFVGAIDNVSMRETEAVTIYGTNQDMWIEVFGGGSGQINDVKLAYWLGAGAVPSHALFTATNQYWGAPHDPSMNLTSNDIDVQFELTMGDWGPPTNQIPCAQWKSDLDEKIWAVTIDVSGNCFMLTMSATDNAKQTDAAVSLKTRFGDGARGWVRITWEDASNLLKFYTSVDDRENWIQLGANRPHSQVGISQELAGPEIGNFNDGQNTGLSNGNKVHKVEVRNGIDGPLVNNFDPNGQAGKPAFTDPLGHTWTGYEGTIIAED